METSIADCHDNCEKSFEELILALQEPERDFGELLTLASIKEEYGRFKVWRGNVGAQHDPSRRISLDYRLRDSAFYRDKIIHHLTDLSEALDQSKLPSKFIHHLTFIDFAIAAELVKGDRLPLDECASPTESSVVSEDTDDEEEEDEGEEENDDDDGSNKDSHDVDVDVDPPQLRRSETAMTDNFAALRDLLGAPKALDTEHTVSFAAVTTSDLISAAGDAPEPEVVQLRSAITDILANLYKLSMLIRRPVPQDRLTRSAKINVRHFEIFDEGYVIDCYPSAQPWLQKRLAKAITRRRQTLIYNRKHHEKLAMPRAPVRANSLHVSVDEQDTLAVSNAINPDNLPIPLAGSRATPSAAPASTRFASTKATQFVPPKEFDDENIYGIDWEAGTQSSYSSTLGGKDVICIPPRPKDADGQEMTQFECPYCFRIQEIQSSRAWR